MTLREKLMHYTYDLDCCSNLKQEAITAIEDIAQYMDEDELLHHSRPLAIAYLALTEDVSAPLVHGRWIGSHGLFQGKCSVCGYLTFDKSADWARDYWPYCPKCGARMDGDSHAFD